MMVSSLSVVLDACVLVPMTLCDTFLFVAARRVFVPKWSSEILSEGERNAERLILKHDATCSPEEAREKATYRVGRMQEYFPDAMVEGFEALVPMMTNDSKDRHVLAAAIRAGVNTIVTSNIRDFPDASIRPYDIDVQTPDDFLMDLLAHDERNVVAAVQEMARAKRPPPIDDLVMSRRIAKNAPNSAAALLLLMEARSTSD